MSRFFTCAATPYLLTCLFFDTRYLDIYLFAITALLITRLILKKSAAIPVMTIIFSIMAVISCQKVYNIQAKSFYPLIEQPVTLECVICDMPSFSNGKATYTVKMLSAIHKGEVYSLDGKAMVYCYSDSDDSLAAYGDVLEFKTKLTLPDEDGLFNYRRYLLGQKISVICQTRDFAVTNKGKYEKLNPLLTGIYSLRDYLCKKCDRFFSADVSAFVKAVLLGESSMLPTDIKNDITRSGISHITSVSGLHLSLIMVILNFFLAAVGFKKYKCSIIIIPVLNILCGVFVAIITGLSPSVSRAALMLVISNISFLLQREKDSVNSLSFAVLILLIINPFALYDVRLVLSATAVLGIVLVAPKITPVISRIIKNTRISKLLSITLAAQIISLPITVLYFNTVSVVSVITNMIIVPLMFPFMSLGVLFFAIPFDSISHFLSGGIWLITQIIFKTSHLFSALPFAQAEVDFNTFAKVSVMIVILLTATIIIVKNKSTLKRCIAVALSCAVMLTMCVRLQKGITITPINTGRGECSLIQIEKKINILVDCGNSLNYESGSSAIKRYLTKAGIGKVDYIILSTLTEINTGTFAALTDKIKTGAVIIPEYLSQENNHLAERVFAAASDCGASVFMMDKGDSFSLCENAKINVLAPDGAVLGCNGDMVFRINYGDRSILFTGNIDTFEKQLLLRSGSNLKADIIKLSDGGEYTWVDDTFTDAVNPQVAFAFTDGRDNDSPAFVKTKELLAEKNTGFYYGDADGLPEININSDGRIEVIK